MPLSSNMRLLIMSTFAFTLTYIVIRLISVYFILIIIKPFFFSIHIIRCWISMIFDKFGWWNYFEFIIFVYVYVWERKKEIILQSWLFDISIFFFFLPEFAKKISLGWSLDHKVWTMIFIKLKMHHHRSIYRILKLFLFSRCVY